MRAVAGVNDARLQPLRQKLGRAGRTVAKDENIGMQRFKIPRGVLERFALAQTGCRRRNVNHVGAQPMGRELERRSRARARFDEEVHQRFAAKRGHFLDLAGADLFEGVGGVENEINLVRGKFAQPKQIFAVPMCAHSLNNQTASGSLSTFWRRT